MAQIGPEGLDREQVDGDCVAREGVEREDVEILRRLALERQPRVASATSTFAALSLRKVNSERASSTNRGIDVVEAQDIAVLP